MPLQETSGTASYDAFGGGAPVAAKYIEQYFSTWLRTGTGASATITTGLDASANKALVWTKSRSAATDHKLTDTVRGATKALISDTTGAQTTDTNGLTAFSSTGYTIGSDTNYNNSGATYVDWEFVATPKFFDVVTYTGDGSSALNISHNLGAVPGCIIVKHTNAADSWAVYHRSVGNTVALLLNSTAATDTNSAYWNNTTPTSTQFTVGSSGRVNDLGGTYVAYLFAHDAGGFGLTGTDNVISCGSFTTDGSGYADVTLGYEPQWLMLKRSDGVGAWRMYDNMRGWSNGSTDAMLEANTANSELTTNEYGYPTATGFHTEQGIATANYIYIAIRRGPMKTPTSGTSVFAPQATAGATDGTPNSNRFTSNFPIDLFITAWRAGSSSAQQFQDRLRSPSQVLISSSTAAETSGNAARLDDMDGVYFTTTVGANSNIGSWMFRRAPGFFDEVCYTGTGSARTVTHNLGVAPEMMILKYRNAAATWIVYSAPTGNTQYLALNQNWNALSNANHWNNTTPTASVFSLSSNGNVNASGGNYVAYLFASCPGVSKVTNFTGNGSTQTINCGFTTGARFVLIKATSTTGNWLVFDTARGMTTSTDPWLALNSTAAESATTGACTTTSVGFTVDESKLTGVNTNGVSYIALAVA